MKEKYFVEGANWIASIAVDTEVVGDPYMEAATQCVEKLFKSNPEELSTLESDDFHLYQNRDNETLSLGLVVYVYPMKNNLKESEYKYIRTKVVAENAGLIQLVSFMDIIEKAIVARSLEDNQ